MWWAVADGLVVVVSAVAGVVVVVVTAGAGVVVVVVVVTAGAGVVDVVVTAAAGVVEEFEVLAGGSDAAVVPRAPTITVELMTAAGFERGPIGGASVCAHDGGLADPCG